MARIETDPNYTTPTFPRATEETDLFKHGDVQALAEAVSTHNHTPGKGVEIDGSTIGRPLDVPGAMRARGKDQFPDGLGIELGYDPANDLGYVQSVWTLNDAPNYKNLLLVGQVISLRNPAGQVATFDTSGIWQVPTALVVGTNQSVMTHQAGHTILSQATGLLIQTLGGAGWAYCQAASFRAMANVYQFGSGLANVTTDGTNLLLRGGGIYCQDTAGAQSGVFALTASITGALTSGSITTGPITASGTINGNGISSEWNLHLNSRAGANGRLFFEPTNAANLYWEPSTGTITAPYGNGLQGAGLYSASIGGSTTPGNWRIRPGIQGDVAMLDPGSLAIGTANHQGHRLFVQGAAGGTQGFSTVSSLDYKTDVTEVDPALAVDLVKDPTLRSLHYVNTLAPDAGAQYGFAAEEFITRLPEVVNLDDQGAPVSMEYTQIIPLLWSALRTTIARVDALEAA